MSCSHKRGCPSHVRHIDYVGWEPGNYRWHDQCLGCGEWLPLGPAKITPEVEIEIRAAELATTMLGLADEWNGFASYRGQYLGFWIGYIAEWQAGYLAAAIIDKEG